MLTLVNFWHLKHATEHTHREHNSTDRQDSAQRFETSDAHEHLKQSTRPAAPKSCSSSRPSNIASQLHTHQKITHTHQNHAQSGLWLRGFLLRHDKASDRDYSTSVVTVKGSVSFCAPWPEKDPRARTTLPRSLPLCRGWTSDHVSAWAMAHDVVKVNHHG